jgi:hypothetical protein
MPELVVLQLRIWEVPCSNLDLERGFKSISSFPSGKFRNYTPTYSLHILTNSVLTNDTITTRYRVWAAEGVVK